MAKKSQTNAEEEVKIQEQPKVADKIEPVKVEETPVVEAHHLDVATTRPRQDVPASSEIKPEDLKEAIENLKKQEAEKPVEVTAEDVQPVNAQQIRKRAVHQTGRKNEEGRQFYFGGTRYHKK